MFNYLLKYFVKDSDELHIEKARIELIKTNIKRSFWTHTIETGKQTVCWTPDNGHHLFYYNYEGTSYKIILKISNHITNSNKNVPFEHRELKMYILGRNRRNVLMDLCEQAKINFYDVPKDYISIMIPDKWGNVWEQDKLIEKIDKSRLFLKNKNKIFDRINKFSKSKEYYNSYNKNFIYNI